MRIKFEDDKVIKLPDHTYQPVVCVPNEWADNIEHMEYVYLGITQSANEAWKLIVQFLTELTDVDPKHCSPYIERSDGKRKMLWGKEHPAYKLEEVKTHDLYSKVNND